MNETKNNGVFHQTFMVCKHWTAVMGKVKSSTNILLGFFFQLYSFSLLFVIWCLYLYTQCAYTYKFLFFFCISFYSLYTTYFVVVSGRMCHVCAFRRNKYKVEWVQQVDMMGRELNENKIERDKKINNEIRQKLESILLVYILQNSLYTQSLVWVDRLAISGVNRSIAYYSRQNVFCSMYCVIVI